MMDELNIKDIINKLPIHKKDSWSYEYSYEDIIKATECDIIDTICMGKYQGDLFMVVTKNHRFGILSTGYGSCCGCDILKACNTNEERAGVAKKLYDKIDWKEPDEIVDYLQNKDWEGEYYGKQEGLPEFISKVKEQLIIRYLAGI